MKYIILFFLSPLFLFSQDTLKTNGDKWGINGLTGYSIVTDSSQPFVVTGAKPDKSSVVWDGVSFGVITIKEPVYQDPSLYPNGWTDTIPSVSWGKASLSNEPITITDSDNSLIVTRMFPKQETGWMVETGWKTTCNGNDVFCADHQWLNINEQTGNYNTINFQIGLSKGDILQECKVCVKCKRIETRLTFMGSGTNPFIWETTRFIYKQLIEKKK